jgi:hypothetical protein
MNAYFLPPQQRHTVAAKLLLPKEPSSSESTSNIVDSPSAGAFTQFNSFAGKSILERMRVI